MYCDTIKPSKEQRGAAQRRHDRANGGSGRATLQETHASSTASDSELTNSLAKGRAARQRRLGPEPQGIQQAADRAAVHGHLALPAKRRHDRESLRRGRDSRRLFTVKIEARESDPTPHVGDVCGPLPQEGATLCGAADSEIRRA